MKKKTVGDRRRGFPWRWLLAALVAAIPPTLASVSTFIVSLRTQNDIGAVRSATDGMKDALVDAAAREGHAAGVKDQKIRGAEDDRLRARKP